MAKILNLYKKHIENIPLFADFSEEQLVEIFQNSHVKKFHKDQNIFLEGEDSINFFITLQGSVQLFVSNMDGKEAVIQIAQKGEILNDLFLDNFTTSASALEDCEILYFQSNEFHKNIKKFPILALNLLVNSNLKNQELIKQITNLKIGNAKEKLGEFLLESSFEDGQKKQEFELKYNKSQIASYLGINPENLSRVLKKLKSDEEISTQKNKIILTKERSLCGYCNKEISKNCKNYDEQVCG